MGAYATLRDHLAEWAGDDAQRRAISETVTNIAQACVDVAPLVALGPLAGDMASKPEGHLDGDAQKELGFLSSKIVTGALKASPVAWMGSEGDEMAVPLNPGAPLAVNVDPLDDPSNFDTTSRLAPFFLFCPRDRRRRSFSRAVTSLPPVMSSMGRKRRSS